MTFISSAVRPSSIMFFAMPLVLFAVGFTEAEMAGELRRAVEDSGESFEKRESKFDLGVKSANQFGLPSATLGLSHETKAGNKLSGELDLSSLTKTGSLSYETGGGHKFSGGVSDIGGHKVGTLSYGKQFDNGNFGVHVSKPLSGGSPFVGLGGSWAFRRSLKDSAASLVKRQSKIEAGVNRGPNGQTSANLGLSHTTSGGGKYSGGLSHSGGRTSGTLGYSRQFGNGRVGAHVSHDLGRGGGTSVGIGGSWRFRRALRA